MNTPTNRPDPSSGREPTHRCFFAVKFSREVEDYIVSVITGLKRHRAAVSWTPVGNIHLTLRFLGDIGDVQLARARSAELPPFHPFTLAARGLGAFPLMRAPRVLWAGVAGASQTDTDRLLHLQQQTERWARALGLPPEERRYRPHITLGRVQRASDGLQEVTDEMITRECDSPFCRIGELLLMKSTPAPGGSIYETVGRWELRDGTEE